MSEQKDNRDFLETLKSDVRESVDLYFAPIKAVVREFQNAIDRNKDDDSYDRQSHRRG
ncbi:MULTISPECIES: hypothetical protein [unclassified Mesorhizobium]|uniref:hypothetical protein n=1 Tax=unclassified Mesorhizobium TaxID=325217 RepID=UPI0003CE15C0|nr:MULTISPECIES: hypothetical protein [unclassified Mesorhizobium]ESX17314.1 hypothetical protein X766_18985 [Mesorhizobium sp. LSJC255A00]ESX32946.1 hypothetical protein X765_07390 [Mesorhizobium sp. LSHC440B00]ESX39988.1 hypothetical protein X763_01045 [Mesorhizobium sp. LSHC432A00]ESX44875.1 hypothetical protein X764_00050 [Mesorhizobium sp. LSHC440A00]ESY44072.1 hypothetical protein X747_07725 [Mesorhizobium sp. LNJC384A00]